MGMAKGYLKAMLQGGGVRSEEKEAVLQRRDFSPHAAGGRANTDRFPGQAAAGCFSSPPPAAGQGGARAACLGKGGLPHQVRQVQGRLLGS